jgi:hypothetical protein
MEWLPKDPRPALNIYRDQEGKWHRGIDLSPLRTKDGQQGYSVFAPTSMERIQERRDTTLHGDKPPITVQWLYSIRDSLLEDKDKKLSTSTKPAPVVVATASSPNTSTTAPVAAATPPPQQSTKSV